MSITMHGKSLSDFIDSLYFNPEMEFAFSNNRFLISGNWTLSNRIRVDL